MHPRYALAMHLLSRSCPDYPPPPPAPPSAPPPSPPPPSPPLMLWAPPPSPLPPRTPYSHPVHPPCSSCTSHAPPTHSPCTPRASYPCTRHAPATHLPCTQTPGSQPVGEEARVELPRARPHRRRRRLLRRLHSEALRGEQAGGGRPPRRLPAAVAAGAPGLQLPRGPLDEAARRRLHPALGKWQREPFLGFSLNGACLRDARRSPDRTPR